MKVKRLIEILQLEDLEREVILARDAEENGYSALDRFWRGIYVPELAEAYIEELTEEDIEAGFTEYDCAPTGRQKELFPLKKALFLIPAN